MTNEDQFLELLQKTDPDLYLIKLTLVETGINPTIMPRFIRSLANLAYGTGYGTVRVFMQNKIVTQIKGEESDQLNIDSGVER